MQQPDLGRRIAQLRKTKGLTQDELANLCRIHVRTLQRIESGAVVPRSYTVRTISAALDSELNDSGQKMYFKRVYEEIQDLFNLKTQKMAKISFLSTVLLSTGLGIALLGTEAKAQQANEQVANSTIGFVVEENGISFIDPSLPVGRTIRGSASGYQFNLGENTIEFNKNALYLNNDYFVSIEKFDTVLFSKGMDLKVQQPEIRKFRPVEFSSPTEKGIRYQVLEKPEDTAWAGDMVVYVFENGLELMESDGRIFLNKEYQFDVREGDTVILDRD